MHYPVMVNTGSLAVIPCEKQIEGVRFEISETTQRRSSEAHEIARGFGARRRGEIPPEVAAAPCRTR